MTIEYIAHITDEGQEEVIRQGKALTGLDWYDCSKIHHEAEEQAADLQKDGTFKQYDVQIEGSGFETLSGRPEFIKLGAEYFTFEMLQDE